MKRDGHGARGSTTLFPLDAELNLPGEVYSFGIRRRAAEEAAKGLFDEVVKVLGQHSGAEIAKRQVEEVVRRAAQDFDGFYSRGEWNGRPRPPNRATFSCSPSMARASPWAMRI